MIKYFIMFILGVIFTIIILMLYSAIKVSADISRKEEKEDYGQAVYNELEKREKEKTRRRKSNNSLNK